MRLNIPSFSPNHRNSGSLILANSRQDSRIQDLENSPLPRRSKCGAAVRMYLQYLSKPAGCPDFFRLSGTEHTVHTCVLHDVFCVSGSIASVFLCTQTNCQRLLAEEEMSNASGKANC